MAAAELNLTVLKNNANLKAYYRFESGALTTDSSGQGKTLTNVNTAVDGTGLYGGAADLGSTNSTKYLYVANDLGITGGACTVSIWVKNNSEIGSGVWKFWTQGDAGTFVDFQLAYEYNSGTRRLQFRRIRRGTSTAEFAYNLTMGTSNWYHLVQTYDGTTVRGYINGAYVGSVASSGNGASNTVDGFTIGADGSDQSGGTLSAYCSSLFDDVAVFNTALSADQIKELYEGRYLGELRPNQFGTTAALYHLSSTTDASGNNYHLINNGTTTFVAGKFGNCADLGTSNSTKYLSINSDLGINNASAITISFWVKLQTEIGASIFDLANKTIGQATGSIISVRYDYNGGTRRLSFNRNVTGATAIQHTITLGTTNWYHTAFTWDTTTQKAYVNGNLVGSNANSGAGDFSTRNNWFSIGAFKDSVDNVYFANALIDEAQVSSTALTANQIRTIYALGTGKYF